MWGEPKKHKFLFVIVIIYKHPNNLSKKLRLAATTRRACTSTRAFQSCNTGKSSLGGNPTSGGQEECGMSHSNISTRAISALQEILTSPVILPDPSRRPTPNTIRSLYISAKTRGQLSQLNSGILTTLIGLFGSLSVDPSTKPVYASSLLPRVRGSPVLRDYWPFVKEVVSFKEQRGMLLAHSDRYWMMRAELASLPTCKEGQRSGEIIILFSKGST